jgi:hypothetical protein
VSYLGTGTIKDSTEKVAGWEEKTEASISALPAQNPAFHAVGTPFVTLS